MIYLIGEIVLCLVAAAVIGWIVGRLSAKRREQRLNDQYEQDRQEYREQIKILEDTDKQTKTQLLDLRREYDVAERKCQDINLIKLDLDSQIDNLGSEKVHLDAQVTTLIDEVNEYKDRISRNEGEQTKLKARALALEEEKNALSTQFDALKLKKSESDRLKAEKQSLQAQVKSLMEEKSSNQAEMNALEGKLKATADRVHDMELKSQQADHEIQALNHQKTALERKAQSIREERDELNAQMSGQMTERNAYQESISHLEHDKKSLENKVLTLERERGDTNSRLQELKNLRHELEDQVRQLQNERTDLNANIASLIAERDSYQTKARHLEQDKKALDGKILSLERDRSNAHTRIQDLQNLKERFEVQPQMIQSPQFDPLPEYAKAARPQVEQLPERIQPTESKPEPASAPKTKATQVTVESEKQRVPLTGQSVASEVNPSSDTKQNFTADLSSLRDVFKSKEQADTGLGGDDLEQTIVRTSAHRKSASTAAVAAEAKKEKIKVTPGSDNDESSRGVAIDEIHGIDATTRDKLAGLNIETPHHLIEQGASQADRKKIATALAMQENIVCKWVSIADLMRIPGVRSHYAALLQAAGIQSVQHISHMNAAALAMKLKQVNAKEHHTIANPTTGIVTAWIERAKVLPRLVLLP